MRFHCDVASDATPHRLENCDRSFGGACSLHLQGQYSTRYSSILCFWNVDNHLPSTISYRQAWMFCFKIVSLSRIPSVINTHFQKKCDFLCCNRRLHKALFSVALEIISRMCPLAWPLYVAKHQILEADIISSSRRWTFVPVSDHKSREPWSSLTSPY